MQFTSLKISWELFPNKKAPITSLVEQNKSFQSLGTQHGRRVIKAHLRSNKNKNGDVYVAR